jgi:Tol biopolymer transport system component
MLPSVLPNQFSAFAAFPGENVKIVFSGSGEDKQWPFNDFQKSWEIYVMNVNGSQQTRLTNNDDSDHSDNRHFNEEPSWSPDST